MACWARFLRVWAIILPTSGVQVGLSGPVRAIGVPTGNCAQASEGKVVWNIAGYEQCHLMRLPGYRNAE